MIPFTCFHYQFMAHKRRILYNNIRLMEKNLARQELMSF
jgi:hypothetical protein